jgi:hypothetical protein
MMIDPEKIAAYADGELSARDAAEVEAAMEADPAIAGQIEAHLALRDTLRTHFAPIMDLPVPDRLTDALRLRDNVVTLATAREAKARAAGETGQGQPRKLRWMVGGAIAASLALGLVLGGRTGSGGPVIARDGQLVASAGLDKALTTQLSSAQDGASVRILLSFKAVDGRFCRGFEEGAITGIACRTGERWTIERTQAGGSKGEHGGFRQAGSAASEIMAAAQAMSAGDALDARAEEAARDAGWRR